MENKPVVEQKAVRGHQKIRGIRVNVPVREMSQQQPARKRAADQRRQTPEQQLAQ